jgi:hypothetical protein
MVVYSCDMSKLNYGDFIPSFEVTVSGLGSSSDN